MILRRHEAPGFGAERMAIMAMPGDNDRGNGERLLAQGSGVGVMNVYGGRLSRKPTLPWTALRGKLYEIDPLCLQHLEVSRDDSFGGDRQIEVAVEGHEREVAEVSSGLIQLRRAGKRFGKPSLGNFESLLVEKHLALLLIESGVWRRPS